MTDLPLAASLPMYDWPEQQKANDELWTEIRKILDRSGVETAPELVRGEAAFDLMYEPHLLFSQTCGLPLRTVHEGKLRTFAAPHYDVEGGGYGTYSSAIILHKDDEANTLVETAGYTLAFNGLGSQSGYSALRYHMKRQGLPEHHFGTEFRSGSHRETILAVAERPARIGAIDSLCWDLAMEFEPAAMAKLRILEWTQANPAMPFVRNEHAQFSAEDLFEILSTAIKNLPEVTRRQLRLKSLKRCDNTFFDPVKQQFEACEQFQISKARS